MSTDQQLKPAASPPPNPPPKTTRLDLSITKILGGALAAMTAAALGSRLGVAGTVIGAAVASIVAAVASALYSASLAHTQEKVKTVFTGRAAGTDVATTVEELGEYDTRVGAAPAQPSAPELDGHWRLPTTGGSVLKPTRTLNWKSAVIAALATFAIAAAALTTFELVSGHALSGGDGTTFTQVGSGHTGGTTTKNDNRPPKPTASATSESTEPSTSATDEPTQEPTRAPQPSSTPEPSSPPSTGVTPAPTASASPAPSASPNAATPAPSGGSSG